MAEQLDITSAARRVATVVAGVPDDRLDAPTPCPRYAVGDLLDHVAKLAVAFTSAAEKELGEQGSPPPGDAAALAGDWRTKIPADLDRLADAWKDPAAWSGVTRAGGIDMSGDVCGTVVIDELVIHGWDLAIATGQDFAVDEAIADAALGFYAMFSGPDDADARGDAFGPPIAVPDSASKLDRVIGLSGRDPNWTPS